MKKMYLYIIMSIKNSLKSLSNNKMFSATFKSFKSTSESILYNRELLYVLLIVVLLNLFVLINAKDTRSVTIFVLVAFVMSFFSKNMMVILFVAFIVTNIYRYNFLLKCSPISENMESMANEDDEEDDDKENMANEDDEEDDDKENMENMANEDDEEDDDMKENMENEDDDEDDMKENMDNMADDDEEDDMKENMENNETPQPDVTPEVKKEDIKQFIDTQENILKAINNMEPLLNNAENFINKYEKFMQTQKSNSLF